MSTRVFVKNLPKYLKEDRLRKHFEEKGTITDCKILKTPYGESRRIGYIGYTTSEEAEEAVRYYNRTFIDTSRISVELSKPQDDSTLPRPWSAYSKGSSKYNKRHGIKPEPKKTQKGGEAKDNVVRSLYEEVLLKHKDDPRFAEFLQVMAPRARNKAWANDDLVGLNNTEKAAVQSAIQTQRNDAKAPKSASGEGSNNDDDEYQDLPSLKTNADKEKKHMDGEESKKSSKELSDMEWLRLHMGLKSDGEGSTGEGEELKDDMKQEEAQEEAPEERIRETGRLFVRNLAYTATEDDLRQHFEKFGPISEIHLPISKETKKSKGFAYVLFMMPEHAVKAYQESDGKPFQGRLMHIIPGEEKPQPSTDEQLGDMANGSDDPRLKLMSKVKKERELKKRVTATSDFNWNSLFMSADAVADAICHRLNISKTDLLESSGEEGGSKVSPAVRLALAETHIIAETKQYLEDNDVDLSVFEGLKKGTRRSDTVILVKNLHFGTMEETLRELFGRHGSLGRVLVPPSGTIGVVEFFEPSEARNAFRSLAYRRLKDAPIYLEKAPLNMFKTEPRRPADGDKPAGETNKKDIDAVLQPATDAAEGDGEGSGGDAGVGVSGSVLFVKNLSFETTESRLREVFSGVEGLRSIVIRRKKDPKNLGQMLSMGFGFVEYTTKEQAKQAQKAFQGVQVDGHALQIKVSDRTSAKGPDGESSAVAGEVAGSMALRSSNKAKGTKLVVKNVAFEATKADLRDLFSSFGQIKSIRLPKKFSGGHRGFAFVEFLTPQVALQVKEQMKDTHLYGRHLVIDWEEDHNATLDDLRAKVSKQYRREEFNQQASASKRIKLNGGDDED